MPAFRPLADRFWEKVDRHDPDDCWHWTGALSHGYGHIKAEAPSRDVLYAHRASYEMLVGPIPEGLHIDHLCRNLRCVNPKHLEPVTRAENSRRLMADRPLMTHCRRGHPFTPENSARHCAHCRGRYCRICFYEARARQRARKQDTDLGGAV